MNVAEKFNLESKMNFLKRKPYESCAFDSMTFVPYQTNSIFLSWGHNKNSLANCPAFMWCRLSSPSLGYGHDHILEQGWANYHLQANLANAYFLWIKIYWHTTMLLSWYSSRVESLQETVWLTKPNVFTILLFTEIVY